VDVAAMLLTGGQSRRMGRDKATIVLADGRGLAERTVALLVQVAAPVIELGPGVSGVPHVPDPDPGEGPLGAVARGAGALVAEGWSGPALVVATDLPHLTTRLLRWLADHPYPGSVIPVVAGRPQNLCARYSAEALAAAGSLVADGRRAIRDLVAAQPAHFASPAEWAVAGEAGVLGDLDEPADLERLGVALHAGPGGGRR
jgi:molybdopterin-guanine dinucleotide biosynthesis protein A